MSNISIREMIDAGVHFGHQSKYWNPKMRPFIYTTYKKLHIINLEKSVTYYNEAQKFIEKLITANSTILFVGTKRAARLIIEKYATNANMPYVTSRWLGGMLTNFNTVKKSIAKLDGLKSNIASTQSEKITKKESLRIKKQIAKLDKNLFGIKDLQKLPDALFVVDTRYEKIAIQEANKLNIPVIAIVDSNNSFEGVEYIIPGNDDSMSSIELFVKNIANLIIKNKNAIQKPSENQTNKSTSKSIKKKQVVKVQPKSDNSKISRKKKISKEATSISKDKST
ncbi:MAG: 30S ribosomal protein S2 [Gammaproteobacteria bacterium]|nr:30S ribosomal protein S2 [Gammaproteobacteria bacterium]|tara:strand:- start:53051 stop:53893 length:843 start_codon:yes stop_codon:yes gene_type:complete